MNYYSIHITDIWHILTLDECLQKVCKLTGITIKAMKGNTRKREVVEARHLFFALACKRSNASLMLIAAKLNKKAHRTVLHGVSNVENIKELNKQYLKLNQYEKRSF